MSNRERAEAILQGLGAAQFRTDVQNLTWTNPICIDSPKIGETTYLGTGLRAWIIKRGGHDWALNCEMRNGSFDNLDLEKVREFISFFGHARPKVPVRFEIDDNGSLTFVISSRVLLEQLSEKGVQDIISLMAETRLACGEQARNFVLEPVKEESPKPDPKVDTPNPAEDPKPEEKKSARDIFGAPGRGIIRKVNPRKTADEIIAEIDSMIGLGPVKQLMRQLAAQQMVAKKRADLGLKSVVPSPHLVFTGNPGTGKTTIARQIGQLYRSLGLLKVGHVIEAERSTLVGGYIGQTAIKTQAVCESARGGVLFVDEAYSLSNGYDRDYGHEAIEALLTFMETNRNNFVLVVAGYPDKMKSFLKANPGLKSRFDLTVEFPDYSSQELYEIFVQLVIGNDYRLTPHAGRNAYHYIRTLPRGEGFGNARDIRKLFNTVIANHASSELVRNATDRETLSAIRASSIPKFDQKSLVGAAVNEDMRAGYL